jgi:hypothetical protein
MNVRSSETSFVGKQTDKSLLARIAAWFAEHNRKALACTWADGARGF